MDEQPEQQPTTMGGGAGTPEFGFQEFKKGRCGLPLLVNADMDLRRFQEDFLRNAMRPGIDMACLSLPRGNGKSWLAAHLAARVLDPDDELFRAGTESVVIVDVPAIMSVVVIQFDD